MRRGLGLVLVALLVAGCRQAPVQAPAAPAVAKRPVIVATIFPLAALARDLVGDGAEVVTLVPSGSSPHTFDLTPETARQLAEAKLLVRVGPGLDDWVAGLGGAQAPSFAAMDHVKLLEGNPEHDAEHGDAHGLDKDPHLWLDPELVRAELLPALADGLRQAGVTVEASRLSQVQERLAALDGEIRQQFGGLRNRKYVAAHPAWRYFNRRYGLEMVAAVEPVGGTEPSARWLSEVVDKAKAGGAACVFTEVQLSGKLDRAVADEAGMRLGVLDPLGGSGVAERDSYEALMRYNARQFAAGLGGGQP